LPETERAAIRWLAGELLIGLALTTTRLAGEAYQQPEVVFGRRLAERLSEGLADHRALESISAAVDRYLAGVLREAGVGPGTLVQSLGAFAPRPPAYVDRLTELIHRFAASPRAAADAARLADLQFASANAGAVEPVLDWPIADIDETSRLLRLLATFVGRETRMPEALLGPLARMATMNDGQAGQSGAPAAPDVSERTVETSGLDVPADEAASSAAPTLFDRDA
jgi:hypothetical protein